jgi:hypothetical protein
MCNKKKNEESKISITLDEERENSYNAIKWLNFSMNEMLRAPSEKIQNDNGTEKKKDN